MPFDLFLALLAFAAATAFTPGPNNIMVTASGVNFGFTRTLPHMFGITLGFVVLLMGCAAGLGAIFAAYPPLQIVLKIVGAAYMLWLAWKIATAKPAADNDRHISQPISFWQAALFQWVNPKAVVIALSAIALYVRPERWLSDLALLLVVFAVATILAVVTWTGFGVALRRLLTDPNYARVFNLAMAALLVVSIVPMVV
ncbi:lysine transporter LysE [Pseudorhodoplanes sinuspersici]|uniref:Lysine transporter LysE n=2 Tax=Pseudorhodoplanes sinuspersici TaxID=1235591 RepID=A0A1W7A019_9HYPH|nr:lysine transporter LysE [Pseudorhodoplanes sinuspersici]